MQSGDLEVIPVDFNSEDLPVSVRQTHPLIYKDGNAVCCILGPDPQRGVFGCGPTVNAAVADFDKHFQYLLDHPVAGDSVSEFIRQRHV